MTAELSPLQEIERRVQLRAKEIALDIAGEGGQTKLRSLIADEVVAWSDGYKRGLRAFDLADPDVVAERAYRNLAGYGPLESLLADDDVWEIMVNSPDSAFIESSERNRGPDSLRSSLSGRTVREGLVAKPAGTANAYIVAVYCSEAYEFT